MDVLPASLALLATLLYLAASAYVARAVGRQITPERGPLIGLLSAALLLHGIVMHEVLVHPGGLHFGLATIATGMKFLWAPLVDRTRVPVLTTLEPFAMDLWNGQIADWLPDGADVASLEKHTYFGGLYQKVVMTKAQ